jgi:predicted membrane protein
MSVRRELQLFLFLVFLLCLNWPVISVTADRWSGYDLFRALFLLWGVMIAVLFLVGRGLGKRADPGDGEE